MIGSATQGMRRVGWLLVVLWLTACAAPPRAPTDAPQWSGRLALRVDSAPPQAFSALFDLRGSADTGAAFRLGAACDRKADQHQHKSFLHLHLSKFHASGRAGLVFDSMPRHSSSPPGGFRLP